MAFLSWAESHWVTLSCAESIWVELSWAEFDQARDLSIIGLFLFTIPRIFNTKNDTIQYQKMIPPKNNFFLISLHFSPFQTILSIFWKSPFLGPKKAHIMGIWAENHPFGVFSYKCLELSNSSRNGIKIQSWIVLNSIEYYRVLKI